MTNRTTPSSSLPRPRTNSTVVPSTSLPSSVPSPPFKPTPPSALLASHNSNPNASRSPSFSSQAGSPSSNMTSMPSTSTQRTLKKPIPGARSASGSVGLKEKGQETRKPLNRKVSSVLLPPADKSNGGNANEGSSFNGAKNRVELPNAPATVRSNSIKRKPVPVTDEHATSTTPGPNVPFVTASEAESSTGYQRKPTRPPPNPRPRVSSVTACPSHSTSSVLLPRPTNRTVSPSPAPSPSNSTISNTLQNSSRASTPSSRFTNQSTTSSPSTSKITVTSPTRKPSSRLRAPSLATKSTSSTPSLPSLPSSQQVTPKSPSRSPPKPNQSQSSAASSSRTIRSAPSSVRRLSQVQGASPNASGVSSPSAPEIPVSRRPVQQPTSTSSVIPPSRLRTPSLGNISLPSKVTSTVNTTPPARRLRTSSTVTSGNANIADTSAFTSPSTTSASVIRPVRAIPSSTSDTSSAPRRLPNTPPSVPTSLGPAATSTTIKAFLFPPIEGGDETSGGSLYSQTSASQKEDAMLQPEPNGLTGREDHNQQKALETLMNAKVTPSADVSQPSRNPSLSNRNASSTSTMLRSSRSSATSETPTRALTVETRTKKTTTSKSLLRPSGPREPLSAKTPTSAPTEYLTSTTAFPASSPDISTLPAVASRLRPPSPPVPTLTPNRSFSSLISIYTSSTIGAPSSSVLSSPSPSLSEASSDTGMWRRVAPPPTSIFGFGMSGSARSCDEGKGKRGRIPSFEDPSSGANEREDVDLTKRREKSMSIGTVRAHDGLGGMMRDEDGRTVGDDPDGSRAPPSTHSISFPNSSSPPALTSSLHSRMSPVPRTHRLSQSITPATIFTTPSATSPNRARYSAKRLSFVQRLGADDMKRLLSKPAVVSGYSSPSDSENHAHRKPSTPVFGTTPTLPVSPRRRVASEESRRTTSKYEDFNSASDVTSKRPVTAASNWVAPWDVQEGNGVSSATPAEVKKGFNLLSRTPSLRRLASEELMTWRKEKEVKSTSKEAKKTRNILRKPSLKNLPTLEGSSSSNLCPPRSNARSPSPARSGSGNTSSSRASSPTRALLKPVLSPAPRTPAEEIMMAYKQQAAREQIIERDFGDEVKAGEVFAMEEKDRNAARKLRDIEVGMGIRNDETAMSSSTATPVQDPTPAKHPPSLAPTAKMGSLPKREGHASTATQGRKRQPEQLPAAPHNPHSPSYNLLESTTGQVVAIGSEKDAFLPSFWDTPAINVASQLGVGNGDVLPKTSQPPMTSSDVNLHSSVGTGRASLQERRSSLLRPLTVSPPEPRNLRMSLDRSREAARPAVAAFDLHSPSASRTNHSTLASSIPISYGTKASKGGIWNLMKRRISAGGLRENYHQSGDSEASLSNTPPPVPPLPKGLVATNVHPPTKLKSPTAPPTPMGPLGSPYAATSPVPLKPRRSMGDWRPGTSPGASKAHTTSSTSSITTGPSATTRSWSPASPCNPPGESRSSSSSYGEEVPTLLSSKKRNAEVLQQHILSPSELSRLQRDFEQEYEKNDRLATTRPVLSKIVAGTPSTSVVTFPRSTRTGPSIRKSDEWMIVGNPVDPPSFSLPVPRYKPRNPSSPSRPSTAPVLPPALPTPIKSMKTPVTSPSHHILSLQKTFTSDDKPGTLPQSRKSTSAIPRPSVSSSSVPSPSRSGVVFRELPSFSRTVKDTWTEKEKADKWDDLLLRSDLAGGTLHLGAADRLESDDLELRLSVADPEDDRNLS
ncbi:hypothetical protein E1B28_002079 [Marasmius oreades]|uniref:Uncharacterized protein n=1 Tax=Marasmius oreades TaxID=181124 RepID=A0A9P7UL47_9AGAR|nr:uncharacterized protein E1B28_002079 [Marasmius oreades]KAG7086120.1 hypothetical protein E1B28_002079 [Marasmius oreades]